MKDEVGSMNLLWLLFHLVYNRDKDGDEFVGFLHQRRKFALRHNLGFDEQLKPVGSLIQFLQTAFHFANKISV